MHTRNRAAFDAFVYSYNTGGFKKWRQGNHIIVELTAGLRARARGGFFGHNAWEWARHLRIKYYHKPRPIFRSLEGEIEKNLRPQNLRVKGGKTLTSPIPSIPPTLG